MQQITLNPKSMKEESNAYSYEFIMKRAYRSTGDNPNAPHMSDLRNLYWFEDADKKSCVKHLKEKTMREDLRKKIRKGLEKVIKWKLTNEERALIESGLIAIDQAHFAAEFYSIVERIDEATKRFKSL